MRLAPRLSGGWWWMEMEVRMEASAIAMPFECEGREMEIPPLYHTQGMPSSTLTLVLLLAYLRASVLACQCAY